MFFTDFFAHLFVVTRDSTLNFLRLCILSRVKDIVAVETSHTLNEKLLKCRLILLFLQMEEATLGVTERAFLCFDETYAAHELMLDRLGLQDQSLLVESAQSSKVVVWISLNALLSHLYQSLSILVFLVLVLGTDIFVDILRKLRRLRFFVQTMAARFAHDS